MWTNANKILATEYASIFQALINASVTLDMNCEMDVVKVGGQFIYHLGIVLLIPSSILIDIDECQNYKCGGRCINLPGTYKCECEKGYKLEGDRCVDEDECATLKPCQGKCINLPGSYRCECDEGYRSERHECIGKIFESSLKMKSYCSLYTLIASARVV